MILNNKEYRTTGIFDYFGVEELGNVISKAPKKKKY